MSFRRLILLAVWTCLLAAAAAAEEIYRHHALVRVFAESPERLKQLYRYDQLDLGGGPAPLEPYLFAYPEDLVLLQREGYNYVVEQENLEQFYADRLQGAATLMGGYRTYAEINAKLDSIHSEHPGITTAKFSIGQSLQGREIWAFKISDNPGVDEAEPEVYYNSLIHAREPAAMEAIIYFMDYLTNNYGTNPDVTYLVNNRELYFVPCVNPDGYVYNQTTNPNGGGMWRKNRRPNGDGSYGVDLNRNYDAAWGIDNQGSSPTPSSDTYRGTAPFSEPETQVQRDFMNSRQFITEIDYHTYQNLVLYPWGTSYYEGDGLTDDNDTFVMLADSMSYWIHTVNNVWYGTGTPWQTLYNTNGGSFDWAYGEQSTKPKIYAVTTEVGGVADGFWPPANRILPLAQENLPANLFMARIAGALAPLPYAVTFRGQCEAEWNGNGNGAIEPSEGFTLTVTLRNSGLQTLAGLQGQLTTASPYLTVVQGTSTWPTLVPNQQGLNAVPFQVTVAANCPNPYIVPLSLHLTSANLDTVLTLSGTVGSYTIVDNVEGGPGGWTVGGANNLWHITTRRAQSPTHSWLSGQDAGNYVDNMNGYLLSDTLVLGPGAELSYDQWYNLELNYDYGHVEINTGSGWTALRPPVTGSSGSWQAVTQPLGLTCPGTLVQIRFRMTTDVGVTSEGWYIDNINTGCAIPADIAVAPASLTGVAPLGGSDSEVLQICNTGACPMTWSISFNQISPAVSTAMAAEPVAITNDFQPVESGKDAIERAGTSPLDNQGGPDNFGHRWRDSNEPGGPVYNWVELVGVGTPLTFTIDDQTLPLTLPWPFSFYGTNYSTVNVSSNGNLHFGTASSAYGNVGIPTATAPNALLAVWWDDLSPQRVGSQVLSYHDAANSRLIVQFDSVQSYSGGGIYTFEVILYQTGRIVYQYQNMGTERLNSATIGIESATGGDGLQVVYNALYVQNGMAIEFWRQVPWLSFGGNTSGSVDPGQCTNLTVNFNAGDLAIGTYTGELIIQSSDPDENPYVVPVSFIVGELVPPEGLTIHYAPATNLLSFRWQSTGAPQYKVYSATTSDGPFTTLVGTTTETSLSIPYPADTRLHYVVVSSE